MIQWKVFRVSCLAIWWRHDIWIPEKLKFDYLKNKRSFRSEIKNIFLVLQVPSFRHTKQTSKNVMDTTFKEKWWIWKKMKLICGSSPRKNKPLPLIHQTPSRISTIVQPPPITYFFKEKPPSKILDSLFVQGATIPIQSYKNV